MTLVNFNFLLLIIIGLIYYLILAPTPTLGDKSFNYASQHFRINYIDDTPNFVIHFLLDGVDSGVALTWTYTTVHEVHLGFGIRPGVVSQSGAFHSNATAISDDNYSDLFTAERITHTTDLEIHNKSQPYDPTDKRRLNDIFVDERDGNGANYTLPDAFKSEGFLMTQNADFVDLNETHILSRGSFKFNLFIQDWPWNDDIGVTHKNQKLLVSANVSMNFPKLLGIILNNETRIPEAITIRAPSDMDPTWIITFANNCEIDGEPEPITTRTIHEDGPSHLSIDMLFPYFERSLRYDPDLTPILSGDGDKGDSDGDGDGNSDTVTIIVAVVVPVAVLTVLLIATILIVVVIITAIQRYLVHGHAVSATDTELVNY